MLVREKERERDLVIHVVQYDESCFLFFLSWQTKRRKDF